MLKKNPFYDPNKAHHTPYGFCNPEPFSFSRHAIKRWQKERKIAHLPHPPKLGYAHFKTMWQGHADFQLPGDRIWWLGHATLLMRVANCYIITDPVFSKRVSPVSFAGPKRFTQAAVTIDELPQIDVIMISHNHYDHLDYKSIKQILARFPAVCCVVPLGLKQKLKRWGAKQVIELDWWQQTTINDIDFHCLPAKHWSQRTLWDRNRSLWCGWLVKSRDHTAYFMGDSGYSDTLFKEIAIRFPKIDIAALAIGAYAPRWFMQNQHIDPAQAALIFNELNCRKAMAIHWGAFELADEPLDEPPTLLQAELIKNNLSPQQFNVIKIGGSITFNDNA